MPQLRKNVWYERRGLHCWDLWVGALPLGRLDEIDGHFIYVPKSTSFERKVFHSYQEAEQYLLEN